MMRAATLFAGLLLAAGGLWGCGFTFYVRDVQRTAPPPPEADGIVVLTGGASRIDAALRLLADGKAPALLISGAGRRSDLADLAKSAQGAPLAAPGGPDIAAFEDRVTIGHEATSTLGNAAETEAWARAHGVHRLIVVTAGYHMPRALLEIAHRLPDVALYPVPVQPPALRAGWDIATLRLLCGEYDKWLVARLGLHRLWSHASPS